MGTCDKHQITKLIELCSFKHNRGKLSFFYYNLREITFMDYLLVIRRMNINENRKLGMHKKWFKHPGIFIGYSREIVGGISIETSLAKVNLVSEETYFFHKLYR